MKRLLSVAIAALLPLFAMEECNRPMVPVPVGGGGYAPSQPSYQAPPIAPGADRMPMLQDPEENLEDNAIEVIATSATQAQNRCEDIAAQRSDSQTIVTCLGCRMRTKTTDKHICTLRIEARPQSNYQPLPGEQQ
jgi:hypothetical protein